MRTRGFGDRGTVAALICLGLTLAIPTTGQEQFGRWEVRRTRVRGADDRHGYPTWRVTFEGSEESPTVRIDGDEQGAAGGHVLIGQRVTVEERTDVAIDFAYATYCALDHRSGSVSIAVLTPQAWDGLGRTGETEVQFSPGDREACPYTWAVHNMAGADLREPRPLDESIRSGVARLLRGFAGREVVIAVLWTAPHGNEEWARIDGLRLTAVERREPVAELLEHLDVPGMAEAAARGDHEAAGRLVLEHFRARFPLSDEKPRATPQLIEAADHALHNRFRSAGSDEFIGLGEKIDWTRCPIEDRQWLSHLHWHEFLPVLMDAYAATGNEAYARKAVELVRDWIEWNPPGTASGWVTLQVALRSLKWLRAYPRLVHAASFTAQDNVAFLNAWAEHAEYLLPESRHRPGHNFGTTQSYALIRLGVVLPEFRRAELWRDTGWQRMEAEITNSVLDDGAQVELTTGYHQSVMNTFMRAAESVAGSGYEPSEEYRQRLERMHEYTMFLTKPDGTQPALGDAHPADQNARLLRGASHFERDDMLFVATRGKEGVRPDYLDTELPSAGYYVMRTDWVDPQAIYLLFDVAHHWGGGHQHFDALQLVLYAFGKTLLTDAGAYTYSGPWRPRFQATAAHSTITIDGANQSTAPAVLHARFSSEALSFLDGSHEGYPDCEHRRQVMFARPVDSMPPYFIVVDRVRGTGERTVDQHFHFRPGAMVLDGARHEARTMVEGEANVLVRALATDDLAMESVESWLSPRYGQRQPRPAVRFRRQGLLPITLVRLIVPYEGASPPALDAGIVDVTPDLVTVSVEGEGGRDIVFAANGPTDVQLTGRTVHARAGLLRRKPTGERIRWTACAE